MSALKKTHCEDGLKKGYSHTFNPDTLISLLKNLRQEVCVFVVCGKKKKRKSKLTTEDYYFKQDKC